VLYYFHWGGGFVVDNEMLSAMRAVMKEELEPVNARLDKVDVRLDKLEMNQVSMQKDITQMQKDITGIKKNQTSMQKDITSIKTKLDIAYDWVDRVDLRVKSLEHA
jgi:peptidoglycan hydrolase CwlO-like protein